MSDPFMNFRDLGDAKFNRHLDALLHERDMARVKSSGANEAKFQALENGRSVKAQHAEENAHFHHVGQDVPENVRARQECERESVDAQIAIAIAEANSANQTTKNVNAIATRIVDYLGSVSREAMQAAGRAELVESHGPGVIHLSWLNPDKPHDILTSYRREPRRKKGETSHLDSVERIRDEESVNRERHKRVNGARRRLVDAKAQAIEDLRTRYVGKPLVKVRVTKDGAFAEIPVIPVHAEPRGNGFPSAPDLTGAYVRDHWDEITAEIARQIDADYGETDALQMSPEEKAKELGKLDAELLELEYAECALIWAARAQGETIPFRPNTDVRAILGVTGPAPKKNRR